MPVPIYNEQTAADVQLRLMQTLDRVFADVRSLMDADDPDAAVQLLNCIRCTMYGIVPTQFLRGVVFGLSLCRLSDVPLTWGLGEGPGGPPGAMPGGVYWGEEDSPWDTVVTRGNLFDGTRILNFEPPLGSSYVHRVSLPSGLTASDCYAFGGVYYRTDTDVFQTLLLGQTEAHHQPVLLDRESYGLDRVLELGLSRAEGDSQFQMASPTGAVLLGRIVVDVDEVEGGVGTYTIHAKSERGVYPFSAGQPVAGFIGFGADLGGALSGAEEVGYDAALVYPLLDQIVRAALWGTSFHDYWVARGDLPDNVKHYYNAIYTPIIP